MPPDPKQTPPDAKPEGKYIPVQSVTFQPGENLSLPGKKIGNSVSASPPHTGAFYSIGYDPRLRSFKVGYHEPGKDLARAPSSVVMVMESAVRMWVPAVPL